MFRATGSDCPRKKQDSACPPKLQEHGSHGAPPEETPTRTAPAGKADTERQGPGTRVHQVCGRHRQEGWRETEWRGGRARSHEEGLTGTCAFSLQRQRGEPRGPRAMEQPLWPRTEGQRQGCAMPRALCAGPRAAARGQRGPCPGQVPAEGSHLTGCQLSDTDVIHPRKQG